MSELAEAAKLLMDACAEGSRLGGWHNDLHTGLPRTKEQNDEFFPTRISLCHSELSESLEGHRKKRQDDHLPHRPMVEVELADALIRIFDLAGVMGYDIGGALAEKLRYNTARPDHKVENRRKEGGKTY